MVSATDLRYPYHRTVARSDRRSISLAEQRSSVVCVSISFPDFSPNLCSYFHCPVVFANRFSNFNPFSMSNPAAIVFTFSLPVEFTNYLIATLNAAI